MARVAGPVSRHRDTGGGSTPHGFHVLPAGIRLADARYLEWSIHNGRAVDKQSIETVRVKSM